MGLTAEAKLFAEVRGDMGRLAEIAAGSPSNNRSEIYMAVALLYQMQATELSERERTLMRDILKRLALDVEMAIRISLAEKLADDPDAPLDLILLLADDAVEVARPIILRSHRLTDQVMLEFLSNADAARQTVCAERPHIGEPVTDKLAASDVESVLLALLRNATARIGESTFETLVEKSRRIAALQEPLAHRADLPMPLATRMCVWASEAIKAYIVESRRLDPVSVSDKVDQAAWSVVAPQPVDTATSGRKLIDKLAIAGQLKPGFLLRVLQQGQTDLFDLAFAKLLEVEPTAFREFFYRRGPRAVALACRAVGIDRCVFPTVYGISRTARGINPLLSHTDRAEIEAVFSTYARKEALGVLQQFAPL